jgi:hypothetical protein
LPLERLGISDANAIKPAETIKSLLLKNIQFHPNILSSFIKPNCITSYYRILFKK